MPKTVYPIKPCVKCGIAMSNARTKTYIALSVEAWKKRKYCSMQCSLEDKRSIKEESPFIGQSKPCPECKTDFVCTKKGVRAWWRRLYCSRACKSRAGLRNRFKKKLPKQCEVCGKSFKKDNTKYCSLECYAVVNRVEENRRCLHCKKEFKKKSGLYCCHRCSTEAHKGSGRKPGNYKGGRVLNAYGYIGVYIPEGHPFAALRTKTHYVLEHRLVMSEIMGRALTRKEQVHHKDGVRSNNAPENLELRTGAHGSGVTHHCPTCTCDKPKIETVYLKNYEFEFN